MPADGGDGRHPALIPWLWRGKVLCPNCLLRAISDAIRAGEPIEAELVEVAQSPEKRPKSQRRRAEIVRLRPAESAKQLELFGRRRASRTRDEGTDDN
jgi:uncharacterized Zn finger protein (UPF0148 family)